MKKVRIAFLAALSMAIVSVSFAQIKTETVNVSGECGMCKKKIEKAAKDAGATYALWNMDTKVLTIKYASVSTNTAKIEKKIAGVGYDTRDFKATDEAYNKLDQCCHYQREGVNKDDAANKSPGCCSHKDAMATNSKMDCSKMKGDGKTAMNCCDEKADCNNKKVQQ